MNWSDIEINLNGDKIKPLPLDYKQQFEFYYKRGNKYFFRRQGATNCSFVIESVETIPIKRGQIISEIIINNHSFRA